MKNIKKRIRLFMFSTLCILQMCFLICPLTVNAKESGRIEEGRIGIEVQTVMPDVDYNTIPTEVKKPIQSMVTLFCYFLMAVGVIAALAGLLFLVISFLGHQNDMKLQSAIAFGVAALLILGPIIIDWLVPTEIL